MKEKLTEREFDVLMKRFGFTDGRVHTLDEIGKEFGITRERVRQIEVKALRKLRSPYFSHYCGANNYAPKLVKRR